MERRPVSRALTVTAMSRSGQADAPPQPPPPFDAAFAAQMLGQGGGRRGLKAGPVFLSRAHASYRAADALLPPARARASA